MAWWKKHRKSRDVEDSQPYGGSGWENGGTIIFDRGFGRKRCCVLQKGSSRNRDSNEGAAAWFRWRIQCSLGYYLIKKIQGNTLLSLQWSPRRLLVTQKILSLSELLPATSISSESTTESLKKKRNNLLYHQVTFLSLHWNEIFQRWCLVMFISPRDLYITHQDSGGTKQQQHSRSIFEMNGVRTLRSVGDPEEEDGSLQRGEGPFTVNRFWAEKWVETGFKIFPLHSLHARGPKSHSYWAPRASATKTCAPTACDPQEKPPQWEALALAMKRSPCSL